MLSNCLKMASENKISTKNTWELPLIDYISDLVKPSRENDDETNFQLASCTLETGVKIYSARCGLALRAFLQMHEASSKTLIKF